MFSISPIVNSAFLIYWPLISLRSTDMDEQPYYFIMANYFYKTHDGKYSPAELAVLKFNFRHGIIRPYHEFINPGMTKLQRNQLPSWFWTN